MSMALVERRPTAARPAGEAGAARADSLLRSLSAEHAGPLLRFVLRLTSGDRHWAEDVVQETLLRLWRNAERLSAGDAGGLWPWLCKVARRIVIDDLRKRQARPTEVGERVLQYQSAADEVTPLVDAVVIRDALNTLSPPHRQALILAHYHGHTVAEIAKLLDLPLGTAKSRLYYGLRTLRQALQERGYVR